MYAIAGAGALAIAVVVFLLVGRGGDEGGSTPAGLVAAMRAGGCTLKTYPSEGRGHVADLNAKIKYKTFPPTSGKHYFSPAIFDQYDSPVNERQAVHNLEHGAIVIQYGSKVPPATVERITAFYREDPNGLLVAPLPTLGTRVALTAWTHLAMCTRFDPTAAAKFRDAYRYHGPEKFAPDQLRPGL